MQDFNSKIFVKPSTPPAAGITGNGTTVGATIDSQGFEALTFIASTGVVTDGTFVGTVYAGSQANMSDEVALVAADLIGPNANGNAIDIAVTDDGVVERVGVNITRVAKRYYRLKLLQAGATTGGFISTCAVLANPRFAPTSTP
jgi:hypothetical protein